MAPAGDKSRKTKARSKGRDTAPSRGKPPSKKKPPKRKESSSNKLTAPRETATEDDRAAVAAAQAQLRAVWQGSYSKTPDPNTKFLLGGVNIRLNAFQMLKAAWHTSEFCAKVKGVAVMAVLDPVGLLDLPMTLFHAISSGLEAVRESMTPLEYVACVVLAGKESMPEAAFPHALRDFLKPGAQCPWYVATRHQVEQARQTLADEGIGELIATLEQNKRIRREDDQLIFVPRNWELGISIEKLREELGA
jgi:hypothetical protein